MAPGFGVRDGAPGMGPGASGSPRRHSSSTRHGSTRRPGAGTVEEVGHQPTPGGRTTRCTCTSGRCRSSRRMAAGGAPTWRDVVNVPALGKVTVRVAFDDFAGRHGLPLPHPRSRGPGDDGRRRGPLTGGGDPPSVSRPRYTSFLGLSDCFNAKHLAEIDLVANAALGGTVQTSGSGRRWSRQHVQPTEVTLGQQLDEPLSVSTRPGVRVLFVDSGDLPVASSPRRCLIVDSRGSERSTTSCSELVRLGRVSPDHLLATAGWPSRSVDHRVVSESVMTEVGPPSWSRSPTQRERRADQRHPFGLQWVQLV